jgi:hypothetical protein
MHVVRLKKFSLKYTGFCEETQLCQCIPFYMQIITVLTYGIQLCGCAKKINIKIIQYFQNKVCCERALGHP